MASRSILLMAMVILAAAPALAQDTRRELRPEVDLYVNSGERVRFDFEDGFVASGQPSYNRGAFTFFVEVALRPFFRRDLRRQPDVFRNRYLTFRAGYRTTSRFSGTRSSENGPVLELTARDLLPRGFVVRDRSRGELRFVEGRDPSNRYRNRLWLEHDIKRKSIVLTPYIYDEIYFDTRYGKWSRNEIAAGLKAPLASNIVAEPYLLWQHNLVGSPRYTEALGMKLGIYF